MNGLLIAELKWWLGTRAYVHVRRGIEHCQHCNQDGPTTATIPHSKTCPVRLLELATEALEEWERGDRHERLL